MANVFDYRYLITLVISIILTTPPPGSSLQDDFFYFTSFAEPDEWAQVYPTCREDFDFQYMREEADKRYVHYMNKTGFINISSPIPQTPEPLSLNGSSIPNSLTPITINHNETFCQDPTPKAADCINRDHMMYKKVLLIFNRPPAKPGSHFVSYGFPDSKKCEVANDYNPCHISPRLGRIRGLVLSANHSTGIQGNRLTLDERNQFASIRIAEDGAEHVFSEAIFMGTGENGTDCSSPRGSHVINGRCYPMEIYMYFVDPSLPAIASSIILVVPVEQVEEGQDNLQIRAVVSAAKNLYEDEKLFLVNHRAEEILEKNYHTLGDSKAIRHLTKDERDIDYFTIPSSVEIERIETLLLDHWERVQTYKASTFLLIEALNFLDVEARGFLRRYWGFDNKLEEIPPNLFVDLEPNRNDTRNYLPCTDTSTNPSKAEICRLEIYLHLYLTQHAYPLFHDAILNHSGLSEFGLTPLGQQVRRVPIDNEFTYLGLLQAFDIPVSEHNRPSVDLFGVQLPPEMDELSDPPQLLPPPSPDLASALSADVKLTIAFYGFLENNQNVTLDDVLISFNITTALRESLVNQGHADLAYFIFDYYLTANGLGYVGSSSTYEQYFQKHLILQVTKTYAYANQKFHRLSEQFDPIYDRIFALGLPQTTISEGRILNFTQSIYDPGSPGEFMDDDIQNFLDPNVKHHPLKYRKLKKTEPVKANIKTPTGDRLIFLGNMGLTKEEYEDQENLKHPTRIVGSKFQISWLIPKGGGYYHYKGSSPVPPCYGAEEVIVFRRPIKMTKTEIAWLTRVPRSHGEDQDEEEDVNQDITNTFGLRHKLRNTNSNPYAGYVFYEPRNHQFLDNDEVHENSILKKQEREGKKA